MRWTSSTSTPNGHSTTISASPRPLPSAFRAPAHGVADDIGGAVFSPRALFLAGAACGRRKPPARGLPSLLGGGGRGRGARPARRPALLKDGGDITSHTEWGGE